MMENIGIGILIGCGFTLAVINIRFRRENQRLQGELDFLTKFYESIIERRDQERQEFYLGEKTK